MPESPADTPSTRSAVSVRWVAAVALALAIAAAWHATAADYYSRSFSFSAPLVDRVAAAAVAGRLEPWNPRFTTRARAMSGWLSGKQLLDTGQYGPAVDALAAAYRQDVGDQELLVLFQEAQQTLSLKTTGIAHVQHGLDPSLTPSPAAP